MSERGEIETQRERERERRVRHRETRRARSERVGEKREHTDKETMHSKSVKPPKSIDILVKQVVLVHRSNGELILKPRDQNTEDMYSKITLLQEIIRTFTHTNGRGNT
jgi:virulence-associated protein VagC